MEEMKHTLTSSPAAESNDQDHEQMPILSDMPVFVNFASDKLTIGGGVAIFHIASERVVLCWHTLHRYWFLPKGRRDANEDTATGAEREGFEESGYRNRLLPVPLRHRQPHSAGSAAPAFVTEPIWTQLMPVKTTVQYLLFWYIAETLPPECEALLKPDNERHDTYKAPPRFPSDLTLSARVAQEPKNYEPVRHPNTGVNAEELLYASYLLPIEEAMKHLRGSVQEDVIRRGWEAIQTRFLMESSQDEVPG